MKKLSSVTMPAKTPPTASESEIRKHYYRDHYVIIAPKRGLRPDSFSHAGEAHKVPNPSCPFCRNSETALFALPGRTHWQVKVIANAFPALSLSNPQAFGTQEVVIDTPDHNLEFSELPIGQIEQVFMAYRQRLTALKAVDGIRYVLVFKNDGPMAGASVAHAHSQIIALPMIPPHIEAESDALKHYQDDHNSCALCDAIAWEELQKVRIIFEDKHMVAISPYAARHGFEVWILPRRHIPLFTDLGVGELHSLATALKKITARLDNANISFNFFLQESIPHQDHHFVLKIEPRTFKWAGAEMGTGVIINPVPPEYAALWYQGRV
jgi:UDPglucose--hexose-1-phosphate uridylyltransferase